MTDAIARYRANWQDEIESAALYQALAEVEQQPNLADIYRQLAAVEAEHARFWEEQMRAAGAPIPPRRLGWRTRVLIWLARRFGPGFVLPTIGDRERMDSRDYASQPESRATLLPAQERSHARVLQSIIGNTAGGLEGSAIAQLEGRHRATSGNALRAAVLGASDGLLSNFSLVMGVAGADVSNRSVLIAGMAGLLAGAFSMALGEWISVQSSRELYERQIAIEREELEQNPSEEQTELALIYQAKGLPADQAQALAARLIADRPAALDTLSREELGVDPEELGGSAWEAAISSFLLFAIGAIIPVAPFFFISGFGAVIASVILSGLGLFGIGAAITLLTGRSVWYSGTRQVLVGLLAASITFGIGRLIGVSLGG
ncbi:rubrerythrin family protein [Chloroflexus islandicus]|uniref:Rubrerythrin family protein n=1 Tax=Chloroflexus islandicus TaxID=1707952 RepID=A0A178LZS9_9CHLR|nr:VIT1/CCC1 transporter family protein [Chloroflexus islandicus]OAN40544.1 rubrerythrin family protein [Chloroflexus islandicus]